MLDRTGNWEVLGKLGNLGRLDNWEVLGKLGNLGRLDNLNLDNLGKLDIRSEPGRLLLGK
jgi:hypothetical protein